MSGTRLRPLAFAVVALCCAAASPARAGFTTFESGQVRPLALSADGSRLFAVNTPGRPARDLRCRVRRADAHRVGAGRARARGGGGAVGRRGLGGEPPVRLDLDRRRLGQPAAGRSHPPGGRRAARHRLRGPRPQPRLHHHGAPWPAAHAPSLAGVPGAGDPQLTTPASAAPTSGCSTPARSARRWAACRCASSRSSATRRARWPSAPDGDTVYAAVFKSGNRTTSLGRAGGVRRLRCRRPVRGRRRQPCPAASRRPAPTSHGRRAPETGLIVKHDPTTGRWNDPLGRDWSAAVQFDLPDEDVFAIDADDARADGGLHAASAPRCSTWR